MLNEQHTSAEAKWMCHFSAAPGKEPGITGDTNCKGLLCADQALDTHFSFNISEVIFAVKYLK